VTPAQHHMSRVQRLGCVVCHFAFGVDDSPSQVHHIAEGSGLRSEFAVAPLCWEHHQGAAGFHRLGTGPFCKLYRVPGETEWGLLVWVNDLLARADLVRGAH